MSGLTIKDINTDSLSVEERYALDILVNLPVPQVSKLQELMELEVEDVISPIIIQNFIELCQECGLDLSEAGVNKFKDANKLGNTGAVKGIIGPQTAQFYFDDIINQVTPELPPGTDRNINQAGLDLVKEFEGLHKRCPDGRVEAYIDPVGIPTIGWGHTAGVRIGDIITVEQAEKLLRQDLESSESTVSNLVKVSLTDNEFSALVSFVFNIGPTAFRRSTLLRKLNQGDDQGAANEFLRWNKGGGRVLLGLSKRREAERKLFLS
ncbi:MAG: lysozyme [Moorea sp. SIO4A3]|nr:lysozyme [Moorena sp. SIO4A3]